MDRLLAHPFYPLSRQRLVCLFQFFCVSAVELTDGRGGGGRGWTQGVKIYYHEKVWSSINHSIHSGWPHLQLLVIHFVIFTHLELSLVFSLVISPSTDIAANVRNLTLLYAANYSMENETMGPWPWPWDHDLNNDDDNDSRLWKILYRRTKYMITVSTLILTWNLIILCKFEKATSSSNSRLDLAIEYLK